VKLYHAYLSLSQPLPPILSDRSLPVNRDRHAVQAESAGPWSERVV